MIYLFTSSRGLSVFFARFGNLYNSSGRTSGGLTGTVIYFERISSSGRLNKNEIVEEMVDDSLNLHRHFV